MTGDKYRATWQGPRRDTQEEALADGNQLMDLLISQAPHLIEGHVPSPADKPVPGGPACNEKSRG